MLVFVLFKMLHYVLERKFNLIYKCFIMPTDWHSKKCIIKDLKII